MTRAKTEPSAIITLEMLQALQEERQTAEEQARKYRAAYERAALTLRHISGDKSARYGHFKHELMTVGEAVDAALKACEEILK